MSSIMGIPLAADLYDGRKANARKFWKGLRKPGMSPGFLFLFALQLARYRIYRRAVEARNT